MNSLETFLQSQSTGMRHVVPFVKMQALGNDFVFVHITDLHNAAESSGKAFDVGNDAGALAKSLCDRHFGIGADGLIIVQDPQRQDCQVKWTYINSDGSPAAMCGNGLRCLALYVVHTGLVAPGNFLVETAIGAAPVEFNDASNITTDLGEPMLNAEQIPFGGGVDRKQKVLRHTLKTQLGEFAATAVSMGNPHCVVFMPELPPVDKMLPAAEALQQDAHLFPEGANVEFVCAKSRSHALVYVVERGCGPTLACATGAAAVQVAGVLEDRLDRQCIVELPGGKLQLHWSDKDNRVRITGPANIAFEGVFDMAKFGQGGLRA